MDMFDLALVAKLCGGGEGEGGGGGAKVVGGSFVGTGKDTTIEHNLGIVPDLVYVGTPTRLAQTTMQRISTSIALSRAFAEKLEWSPVGIRTSYWKASSSSSYWTVDTSNSMSNALDEEFGTMYNSHIIADETSFTMKVYHPMVDTTYYWIAIGGLT